MGWSNWSGLEHASPSRVITPGSLDEVIAAIVAARDGGTTLKAAGTGHSFTAIASPGSGTHLLPGRMTGIVAVDREAMTVTARAGTQLKTLNADLERLGLSLHNMGDIAEQTLAGAVSTGTHGTGGLLAAGLSAQLAGFTIVTGTGEVLSCSATSNPEVFALGRVGLGALGVLVDVTFMVEPLFALEAVEQPMSWEEFHGSFDAMTAEAHHVDAYWFPHTDRLLTKRNTRLASLDETEPLSATKAWFDDNFLQNTAFGTLAALANLAPGVIPRMNRMNASLLSPRTYSDVAHRVFVAERRVVFREMEYAVPRADGLEVLRECRRALDASDLRISFPVELRVAPADDVALSTAYERDSFYLAFHTHHAAEHRAYFALLEPILRAAGGRPHWGKIHTQDAASLAERYPRFAEFVALRDRLDPDRVFGNDYLRRVLGA
ncbi:D-arabinono-1,4-lactone oxidase [Nocardioides nematodiphilus]|uniref:D-arabinono-1,4-lactone oxidase n=1 Tax=Nocardioides nematodiphilus TaxID=2849669 RepID=UPI001CDA24D2|nr:D-arabinono-1,4-lactone oxidase [Nocardioides nematodiphilus]MCA1982612.1 FAD-binding protein [Nocardioides nematodiphilus]